MSRWTLTGELYGRQALATWENGQLTGTPALLEHARLLVEEGETVPLTPQGPMVLATLEVEPAAHALLRHLLRNATHVGDEVDVPEAALPDGAVP